ncbi:MAG: histidine phosphatase family protein [Acidimicrobiia bacterium]|nr:histidine phosphatase family protein [Acidimicrobiia bacterium]
MPTEIIVVRHGATEWSENGRHTGRTDLPLTAQGRAEAEGLRDRMSALDLELVLTSPLMRARETADLAGVGDRAEVVDAMREWDYGEYEGVTTAEIRQTIPGWTVWAGPCPGGESAADVGARADAVLARVANVDGAVAVFSHGHYLRVLVARWLGLPPADGRLFALATAAISILSYEREQPVLRTLNG